MRPHGPIRQAALRAAWEVVGSRADQPWVTRHDLEQRLVPAGVGRRAIKFTWENLLRSGALRRQGRVFVPTLGRQVLACEPVALAGPPQAGGARSQSAAVMPDLAALWWRGGASSNGMGGAM